jgi:integrase
VRLADGRGGRCSRRAEAGHVATVQKSLGRLRKATGIDFRIHDIRRTVATKLGALGITDDVVSRVLSHSTGGGGAAITRRHYNLAQQVGPTRAALQALSDPLDAIVAEKPARGEARETYADGRRLARRRIA